MGVSKGVGGEEMACVLSDGPDLLLMSHSPDA